MSSGFGQGQPQQQFQPQQQQFQQQPQQFQQQPVPQQQFRQPQEQTLQAGVKVGGPQQGARQPYYSPAPPQQQQQQQGGAGAQGGYVPPHVPEFKVAGVGGGPYQEYQSPHRSRFSIGQLRQSDGIIPLQYGTNRFASQKRMTGFGTPRDVNGKHLHRIWDDFYTDESEPFEGQEQQQYYAQ